MPSENRRLYLSDILENVDLIRAFTAQMTFDDYRRDAKTMYAVTRALEIISEASRRLSDDLKARHTQIHWPGIAAAGNVYRHAYRSVDDSIVWNIIERDLAPLRSAMVAELTTLREGR